MTAADFGPRGPDALVEQAVACHRAGRLAEAEALYRQALVLAPSHPGALHYLGLLGYQTGHLAPAEALLAQAARAAPGDPVVLNNWGIVLAKLGRLVEARARFSEAVARGPGYADALVNLANVLADSGDLEGAERRYREAITIAPGSAEAHNNLGRLHLARRRVPEAVACFEEALRVNPGHGPALNNLGNALRDQGRFKEAFERYRAAQLARPDHPEAFSNLLLAMNCDPDLPVPQIQSAHREFADKFERPLAQAAASPFAPRRPGRLRVGYVSADFRSHAVAAFVEPLFAHHDRARVETTAYYNAYVEDEVTHRIRDHVEHFVVVAGLTDAELAQRIRSDAIDVLVDLSGHTAGNRLLAFARRAAPVQATWLGYLNTTGLSAMDFRITDNWADPPGATEQFHSENLVRLPASQWCYRAWRTSPPVVPLPCLEHGYVTFGSTNNPAKLNATVLGTWARLLDCVPGSRILVHAPEDSGLRIRIAAALQAGKLEADRVSYFPRLPAADYLAQYGAIDVALDTFPCSGGTTTFDALWMGVPVVSLAGERPFSRGGASILGNLGFPRWIADTPERYVERAAELAGDPQSLAAIRASLRGRLAASALMDAQRFAKAMEEAFVNMCRARGVAVEGLP